MITSPSPIRASATCDRGAKSPEAPPEPIETDLQLFGVAYPALADLIRAKFKIVAPTPNATPGALFPLGSVRIQSNLSTWLADGVKVDDLVVRHAAGDLGQLGQLADVTLDADMLWCPHVFDSNVRARVAIERGAGLVCSCYPVAPAVNRAAVTVSVATLFDPSGPPQTVVWGDEPETLY